MCCRRLLSAAEKNSAAEPTQKKREVIPASRFLLYADALCTETGEYQVFCSICGEPKTIVVEADGHEDANEDGICDICGASLNGSDDSGTSASGVCDKCGKDHGGKEGGFYGYDGFVCKLIAFFRMITRLFSK